MKTHTNGTAALLLACGAFAIAAFTNVVAESAVHAPVVSCEKTLSPGGESAVRVMAQHFQQSRGDARVVARCLYFKGAYDSDLVHRLRSLASPEGVVSRLPYDNAIVVVDAADRVEVKP